MRKTEVYKDVKDLGQQWINGNKKARERVLFTLLALRKPKCVLYPVLLHRYITKELGFQQASEFALAMVESLAD